MNRRVLLAATAFLGIADVAAADRVDDNLQRMLEAARQLEYADGNAWLLEKLETIRAPVAVVFGYADNEAACRQIADLLSASGQAGTFECVPIY
jgi:hypothetical protein